VARYAADDLWRQLGITQQQGMEKIRNSFMNGYLEYYGVKNAKNIASGNRAGVTKDLLSYAKTYVNSTAFRAAWEKERLAAKPTPPEKQVFNKEDIRNEKLAEVQKWIKQSQDLIKQMPQLEKDMKKTMEEYNKIQADYKDPNSKMIDAYYQQKLRETKDEMTGYEESIKKWNENYPADQKQRIKKYLQKYLEVATTVDFDAALTEKYGKKIFVKKEYEYKGSDWKMIFRAGKEVYEVAKPFTEQWFKEL
jgi:flagellar biosynthesis/type III secretory pathway chaperone